MHTAAILLAVTLLAPQGYRRQAPPQAPSPDAGAQLTDPEIASRVETYLSAVDTRVTNEDWQALGPRAVAPLETALGDPAALPSRRARAVGALAAIGGSRAQQLVLDTARSERQPFAVRAAALEGSGRLLRGKALTNALRGVLQKAGEAPVRGVAADVLAQRAGASGCAAVRAQAAREPRAERGHFARALETCGGGASNR